MTVPSYFTELPPSCQRVEILGPNPARTRESCKPYDGRRQRFFRCGRLHFWWK